MRWLRTKLQPEESIVALRSLVSRWRLTRRLVYDCHTVDGFYVLAGRVWVLEFWPWSSLAPCHESNSRWTIHGTYSERDAAVAALQTMRQGEQALTVKVSV